MKAIENGGERIIKALLEDCLMEITLKSPPWEKIMIVVMGHLDSNKNNECKILVKCDFLSENLCEEKHLIAYVISQKKK